VMLSEEAGRLPEQLFLKVGQCLELAACLYSPSFREGVFPETWLPVYGVLGSLKGRKRRKVGA